MYSDAARGEKQRRVQSKRLVTDRTPQVRIMDVNNDFGSSVDTDSDGYQPFSHRTPMLINE